MMTEIKMQNDHVVMESSPKIRKETNGSDAQSGSRGVMKATYLVAVTVLHLRTIFPGWLNEEIFTFAFHVSYQPLHSVIVYVFIFCIPLNIHEYIFHVSFFVAFPCILFFKWYFQESSILRE